VSRASHAATFLAGVTVAAALRVGAAPSDDGGDRYHALDAFAQALADVANEYVEPIDESRLIHDATRGMLASLDRHSQYFSPRRYTKLRQDTEGEYASVGLVLGPGSTDDDDPTAQPWPYVDEVIEGSPAARAGIRPDDRLVSVAGEVTAKDNKETREAGAWETRLRGATGTRINIQIWRTGDKVPRDLSLVREQIKVPSVTSEAVEPGVGYLAVRRFAEATSADVAAGLTALEKAGSLKVLVLDLRQDPGGLVDQAVKVADLFLDDGLIVTIRGRRGAVEQQTARKAGTWPAFPIFCLVDGGSASAAEILAGALGDRKRATLIGSRTYGKGSVQTFFNLDDGAGLKLTTARYYTPSGRSLEGSGITPDIVVNDFDAVEVVAGAPGPGSGSGAGSGGGSGAAPVNGARILERMTDDPQLARAIQEARRVLGSK
jgi:carboxyl-terminal processing protease